MKYYGPQTETRGTIEQEIRQLPFEFNYSDHTILDRTIHAHTTVMETYIRKRGNITPASNVALTAQIEKRMVQNSALYTDYKEAKAKDLLQPGYAETWQTAIWRWAKVIQDVRDIASVVAKYGNLKETSYTEDAGTLELRQATDKPYDSKTTSRTATKTASTASSAIDVEAGQKSTTLDKPISKRGQDTTEGKSIFVTGTASCNRCGQAGHRAETCPFTGAQDTNARTEHTWTDVEEMRTRLFSAFGNAAGNTRYV